MMYFASALVRLRLLRNSSRLHSGEVLLLFRGDSTSKLAESRCLQVDVPL